MPAPTLADLRRFAVARTFFTPTTLPRAIAKLGFVQADPIRAPARAQDLTLRHRVQDYRAGDLERRYPRLPIEEDFFVNYGFLPRQTQRLMHPRTPRTVWPKSRWKQAHEVLAFVREHGSVHPRDVDAAFDHGKTRNWFGGSSNASTELLDGMHYRGLVRIARREGGVRVYAPADATLAEPRAASKAEVEVAMDQLVDVIVAKYAPLLERSLGELVNHLRGGVPHWDGERRAAFERACTRLPSASVDGQRWFWPAGESPRSKRHCIDNNVRLLAPFDPLVWDRRRFERLWGWAYRFEAYTPPAKRLRGYYALPLLWRDNVIGWANVSAASGRLVVETGFVSGRAPKEAGFAAAFDEECGRMADFLGLAGR